MNEPETLEDARTVAEIEEALRDLIATGGSKGEIAELTEELIDAREEAAHAARLDAERQRVEADMAREAEEREAQKAEAKRLRELDKDVSTAEADAAKAADAVNTALEALDAAFDAYLDAASRRITARRRKAKALGEPTPPTPVAPGFRLKGAFLISAPSVFKALGLTLTARGKARPFNELEG